MLMWYQNAYDLWFGYDVVVIPEFVCVKLILECIIFVLYVNVKWEYINFMVCNEKLEYI